MTRGAVGHQGHKAGQKVGAGHLHVRNLGLLSLLALIPSLGLDLILVLDHILTPGPGVEAGLGHLEVIQGQDQDQNLSRPEDGADLDLAVLLLQVLQVWVPHLEELQTSV